jgi:hypothetical protein
MMQMLAAGRDKVKRSSRRQAMTATDVAARSASLDTAGKSTTEPYQHKAFEAGSVMRTSSLLAPHR